MSDEIRKLREERADAVAERGACAARVAQAKAALRAAEHSGASDSVRERLADEQSRALGALEAAVTAEAKALASIGGLVADAAGAAMDRIGELDASYPVALFPVRVETRFRRRTGAAPRPGPGVLLVRIYPDGALAHSHEPLLTELEVAAGQAYWRRVADGMEERDSWSLLVGEATAERAAWIVERTMPSDPAAADPEFPEQPVRPPGWHRAPEAPTLPDCWIVTAFRDGAVRHRAVSGPVEEGLALALRMSADTEETSAGVDLSGDGLDIEPALRWAYDFETALEAGMAVRIEVEHEDLERGFDTVLVTGVRTTLDAKTQAGEIESLLDGHRYNRGLAFVRQGAMTNNSVDGQAAYPPSDPGGAASFAVARGPARAAAGTDGHRLARALGIEPKTFDHVDGAERDEQTPAAAMLDALWPATLGYFLDQLMAPDVSVATARRLRDHARDRVRARGHLAALRVGSVPYGVLPVSALARWKPGERADAVEHGLARRLQRLAPLWREVAAAAPHLGRSGDPEADLVETLALDASAQTVQIRRTLGQDAYRNMLSFFGIPFGGWQELQRFHAELLLRAIGEREIDPRLLYLTFADEAHDFAGPLVQREPLSETDELAFNYLAWLRTASPGAVRDQQAPPSPEPIDALLYLMLRHALLREYDDAALELLSEHKLAGPAERYETELVGIVSPREERTAWDRLDQRIAGVTGERTIGDYLADARSATHARTFAARAGSGAMSRFREDLRALEGLPSAELDRLFTETLDTCSHRLDPWITGLYAQRLEAMREAAPRGLYTACYGWVHDLVADPPGELVGVTTPQGKARARTDSGGYVYAPSMTQGATAAVLRSAHIARGDEEAYAVGLSSRRVRTAIELIDAVRAEQPLGAVLGYRFERGLHEGHPGLELDEFIDVLRGLYPLVADKAEPTGEPAETVAARNVVDGLRLRAAARAGAIPWGSGALTPDAAERAAIEEELGRLDDAVDAVSDLLLAESVHQVVRGSAAGAAATLDSLAKGHRPPEPEVASTPRGGAVLHQRLALVVAADTLSADWTALGVGPRAAVAPEINAWLAARLGPPEAIGCVATPEGGAPETVTVADLALQPVDLLDLAATAQSGGSADLDRRVAWHVAGAAGPDVAVTIDYADAGDARLPLGEALELLAEVSRALGFARPLEPRDLLPPEAESAVAGADPMTADADGRAQDAEDEIDGAVSALSAAVTAVRGAPAGTDPDVTDLRTALVRAADAGVTGAFPSSRHGHAAGTRADLLALADAAAAALAQRVAARDGATTAPERIHAAFGRGLPVLPRFRPAETAVLGASLAREPDLGGDAAVERWLAGVERVREPLDAWRHVLAYAGALGTGLARPRIAQVPLEDGARWAALEHDGGVRHRSGLTSLALFGTVPAADEPWSGLLLDTWPEVLPNVEEDAGVVLHYDAPGAHAPHCVLLAVPPTETRTWSYEVLEETLLDTLDLARMRSVDLRQLGALGQLLPAAYLAANPQNAAIATSFVGLVMADAEI